MHINKILFKISIGVALLVAPFFYAWTIKSTAATVRINGAQGDYYNLLVDGFLEGHLYMKAKVDPQLLAMAPEQRPGGAPYLLDASLYKGNYYLYFGVTPAICLFLPFHLITNHDLPEAVGCFIFILIGYFIAAAWWWRLFRKFFPNLSTLWYILGVLAIGFCTAAPSALRRPLFYETTIAAGFAAIMFLLWAFLQAIYRPKSRLIWLFFAGIGVGLSVGSRANLAPGGIAALICGSILIARGGMWGAGFSRLRLFWLSLLVTGLGAVLVGSGLALYNYLRFGNVMEFGHHYQLGQNPMQMFRLENFWHNLQLYYFSPPALNGYFPFVAPSEEGPKPFDYIGREHVHGEWLWTLVLVIIVFTLVLISCFYRIKIRKVYWMIIGLPFFLFLINGIVLGLTGVRANRYMLDFHPALVLVTVVLMGALISKIRNLDKLRWMPSLLASLIIAAIIFNILASMQMHGFYALNSPASYDRLANISDRIVWPVLRSEHDDVGSKEVKLRWPAGVKGLVREPLLSAGTKDFYDVIWIDYDADSRARIAYRHGEYTEVHGRWFDYKSGERAKVLFEGALLLPAVSHPWYGDTDLDERIARKRHLRVLVNDQEVFNRDVLSFDSSPRLQRWGEATIAGGIVSKFRGDIQRILTLNEHFWWKQRENSEGTVRFRIELPANRYGATEPLLQFGNRTGFDTLAVIYLREGWVQLVHDQLGGGAQRSEPIPIDYSGTQFIEIESPAATDNLIWTKRGPIENNKTLDRISIYWNDRLVFEPVLAPYNASRHSLSLGVNWWNSSSIDAYFTGTLHESPPLKQLAEIQPGFLDWSFVSNDTLADLRGVVVQFARTDGEKAALMWQRSSPGGRLSLGWLEGGITNWIPDCDDSNFPLKSLRLQIGKGVWTGTESAVGWVEIESGGQVLLSTRTTFFNRGRVQARALLADRWTGSALVTTSKLANLGNSKGQSRELPGRVRLRFALPEGGYVGSDPLFSGGKPGAADSIYLKGLGQGSYVLGLDHWSVGSTESASFALDASGVHSLLIELGSLASDGEFKSDHVRLILNEKVLLDVKLPLFPVKSEEIVYGLNPHGMSTSSAAFRGSIISVRTHEPLPANLTP